MPDPQNAQLPGFRVFVAQAPPRRRMLKLDRVVERWTHVPFSRVLTVEHAADHRTTALDRAVRRIDVGATCISFFEHERPTSEGTGVASQSL